MTSREAKKRLNKEKLNKLVGTLHNYITSTFNSYNNTRLRFDIKDKEPQFKSDYLRYDFSLAMFESSFDEAKDERIYLDLLHNNPTSADEFELDVIDPSMRSLKKFAQSLNTKAFITNTLTNMNGRWYVTYMIQIRIPYDLILNGEVKESMIEDVKLDETIEVHDTLNFKLFDKDNELRELVKYKLINIVEKIKDIAEENEIALDIKDVILLGSNCSYNYTKDSDIDLHIIADTTENDCTKNHLEIIYNLFKSSFNDKFEITIKGIPVELYIEENETSANSNGIYSLYSGWIKKPTRESIPDIDYEAINKKVDAYVSRYNDLLKELGYDEDIELDESIQLNEMKGKEVIKDKRILDLIHSCIDDLRGMDYDIKDDIYFTYGDALNTFGVMKAPDYEGGWWTLILNKFMIDEPDEAIKSTIYHELAHYINDNELIDEGVYFWKGDTLSYNTRNYKRGIHGVHGKRWQEIADKISLRFGIKISRTDDYKTHTGVGKQYDSRVKYIVRCKHCGNEYKYTRKTDFVKFPNMSLYDGLVKKYGVTSVEKFYSDNEKQEMKNRGYWNCGKCHKSDFEVEEI